MTHDKLLAKLDDTYQMADYAELREEDGFLPTHKALRAVVELHKPDGNNHCVYCNKRFACEKCGSRLDSYIPYPCPTIQAITEQLK